MYLLLAAAAHFVPALLCTHLYHVHACANVLVLLVPVQICFVEDAAFYDLATPTYDRVDWELRASRGGDGAPAPKVQSLLVPSLLVDASCMRPVYAIRDCCTARRAGYMLCLMCATLCELLRSIWCAQTYAI